MPLFGGPHQSRGPSQRLFRIHIDAGGYKNFDRIRIAVARGEHHHRLARRTSLFYIGPCFDQAVDHPGIAVQRGQVQRRDAFAVLHINAGACIN